MPPHNDFRLSTKCRAPGRIFVCGHRSLFWETTSLKMLLFPNVQAAPADTAPVPPDRKITGRLNSQRSIDTCLPAAAGRSDRRTAQPQARHLSATSTVSQRAAAPATGPPAAASTTSFCGLFPGQLSPAKAFAPSARDAGVDLAEMMFGELKHEPGSPVPPLLKKIPKLHYNLGNRPSAEMGLLG